MRKVIHLLPYDGIGGAEAAARSMVESPSELLDFQLRFLFPQVTSRYQRLHTFNPLALLAAVRGVVKDQPDLLIVSLWRSCLAGALIRLLRPRTKMVVLIHNSVDAHWLDFICTRLAVALSCEVWADSDASLRMRFRHRPPADLAIIPFLTRRLEPLRAADEDISPTPGFIYWGRLARQKNLPRALRIFRIVWQAQPDARFTVIGPDGGALGTLRSTSAALGMSTAVSFVGALAFEEIMQQASGHAFYLQTSEYEGMAMSVVESMQLGLVAVVTPVGEVGRYCRDGSNAVIVATDEQAAAAVLRLLHEPAEYNRLRRQAILAWQNKPHYRDAVIAECLRLTGDDVPADDHEPPRT